VSPAGPVLPQWQPAVLLGRLAGVLLSRASPGSRTRLPVAAAFFFLLRKRKVIPAGPRQGQASLRSVRTRTLDMTFSARIEEAREGGRKTQMPQQPAASRPGDAEHNVSSRQPQDRWRGRTGQPPQVPRCSTQPSEKTSEEVFYFLNPKTNPEGALRAQERQHHADRSGNRRNPGRRQ
jgi:hypothetical protein